MDRMPDVGLPDWGLGPKPSADVKKVKFGDGYELRRPSGLNHIRESYSPKWSHLTPETASMLYNWLKQRQDWKAFEWQVNIYGSVSVIKVVCNSVNMVHDQYGNAVVSAELVQDFNP